MIDKAGIQDSGPFFVRPPVVYRLLKPPCFAFFNSPVSTGYKPTRQELFLTTPFLASDGHLIPITHDKPGANMVCTWVSVKNHCNFAYSALACLRMGMSGSASFHVARKSS
jgi:hypothetical protein